MLRRVLYPLRETFHVFLRPDHTYFSAGTLVYFQDLHSHILRILDVLDMERDMADRGPRSLPDCRVESAQSNHENSSRC